jgi:hypothetical protein
MNTAAQILTELIVFTKANGPLTKRICLADDGQTIVSDGSACVMWRGTAQRTSVASVADFAALIEQLHSDQAIALGALRPELPDHVSIVTKDELNGVTQPDIIARTSNDICYRQGQLAFALFDFDRKGMPAAVAAKLQTMGGFWAALCTVLPVLQTTAHLVRRSTSAGLHRTDTGAQLPGSGGLHGYVVVQDGNDIERFLTTLHDRCWLAGLGWLIVGVAGQLLERSIVDRMVGAPERLVFEGPPVLVPPLAQDAASRRPLVANGDVLDTVRHCPPLTVVEQYTLAKLRAAAAQQYAPERARARDAFIARQMQRLASSGLTDDQARRIIARQTNGVLLPDVALQFDDVADPVTVAAVLADPARYDGCTLADPLEGIEYGRCKAKVMRRSDGTPWIHSFAHGRAVYALRYDAAAVRRAIEGASDPVATLAQLVVLADLDAVELKQLIDAAAQRARVGVKTVTAKVNETMAAHKQQAAREARERRLAARNDPRPQLPSPPQDAPWQPQIQNINEVLAQVTSASQPQRDIEGSITHDCKFPVPGTHPFVTANEESG